MRTEFVRFWTLQFAAKNQKVPFLIGMALFLVWPSICYTYTQLIHSDEGDLLRRI